VAYDGRIKGNTQTCYVLALAFDLVEAERAKRAADYLVEDIEKRGWHLSTGFIGTKDLMLTLTKIGRPDVALRLLHNDTFPSWGFSIKHGATSIWERWDGWTPEKGFQDPGMNSFAHYSFGAVYQWMVENLGGIRSTAPAYKELTIVPLFDPQLTHARVEYRSARGLVAVEWQRKAGRIELAVTLPANTTSTLALPAKAVAAITENGGTLDRALGIRSARLAGPNVILEAGSGSYDFVIRE
jgi:alpha-L-rhamnosidase